MSDSQLNWLETSWEEWFADVVPDYHVVYWLVVSLAILTQLFRSICAAVATTLCFVFCAKNPPTRASVFRYLNANTFDVEVLQALVEASIKVSVLTMAGLPAHGRLFIVMRLIDFQERYVWDP